MNKVYILKYKRSPYGSYLGCLSNDSIIDISGNTINSLINECNINKNNIDISYIGNVISAGNGQNIARIITKNNGINCPSITVNNVCGSGMESIYQGYNSILLNNSDCVLVGGVEHMSSTPYLNKNIKKGNKMGNIKLIDSMINDGLTDGFSNNHMGILTHNVNISENITIDELNKYAYESYLRARQNINHIKNEIEPYNSIDIDEEINKIQDLNKLFKLKPVFGDTITAGNASKLSDGCSFMILCSEKFIKKYNLKPVSEIINIDISSGEPELFPIVPVDSVINLCNKSNININDIDLFEVNEAFATVPLYFSKQLNISLEKINVFGGAIAIGHPLGSSGTRITGTLINALHINNKKLGCATICVGGGQAYSILLSNIIT